MNICMGISRTSLNVHEKLDIMSGSFIFWANTKLVLRPLKVFGFDVGESNFAFDRKRLSISYQTFNV